MFQISPLMLFPSEKELFRSSYLLKMTPRVTKILISSVWGKVLKIWDSLFEPIQIEVQRSKNYFNIFLPQEAGAFGKKHRKGTVKATPKIEKIFILYADREYLLCLQFKANGSFFLQKCIICRTPTQIFSLWR